MRKDFSGLIVPVLTPLDERRKLDEESFVRLIHDLRERGVNGLYVTGTTGEASQLPYDVWKETNRVAIRETQGAGMKAYCGAVCPGTLETIERVKTLEALGAETIFATPVFYSDDGTQEQIYLHYKAICDATRLNVVVYSIPFTTHVEIAPKTLMRIAELPNVVGVKDTRTDWNIHYENIRMLKPTKAGIACVVESMQEASLLMGADGIVTALGNFMPEYYTELLAARDADDLSAMNAAFQKILTFRDILSCPGNGVAGFKYLGSLLGICKPYTAVTCVPVGGEQAEVMRRAAAFIRKQRSAMRR